MFWPMSVISSFSLLDSNYNVHICSPADENVDCSYSFGSVNQGAVNVHLLALVWMSEFILLVMPRNEIPSVMPTVWIPKTLPQDCIRCKSKESLL